MRRALHIIRSSFQLSAQLEIAWLKITEIENWAYQNLPFLEQRTLSDMSGRAALPRVQRRQGGNRAPSESAASDMSGGGRAPDSAGSGGRAPRVSVDAAAQRNSHRHTTACAALNEGAHCAVAAAAHAHTHTRMQDHNRHPVTMAAAAAASTTAAVPHSPARWAASAANAFALLRRWAAPPPQPVVRALPATGAPTALPAVWEVPAPAYPAPVPRTVASPLRLCEAGEADDEAVPSLQVGATTAADAEGGSAPDAHAAPAASAATATTAVVAGMKRCRAASATTATTGDDDAATTGIAAAARADTGLLKRGACPHGRLRCRCKECGGGAICEHGRARYSCKECGGNGICKHSRVRYQCKECGGAGICVHDRVCSKCKECGGAGICAHGRRRHLCKECGGTGNCDNGRSR